MILSTTHLRVAEVYLACIGENEANIGTIQMLTNIENKLEELFDKIDRMPLDKVAEAEKVSVCITAFALLFTHLNLHSDWMKSDRYALFRQRRSSAGCDSAKKSLPISASSRKSASARPSSAPRLPQRRL